MATQVGYPLRVEAELEPELSRWRWLVKWFLAIPHLLVLGFLWAAFAVLTIVAFFAILFTGRYPRAIFEFNVGVLRWSWRVTDYCYGVLATDTYPPFTLAADPAYPARLEVAYPEHLSRGLVLVKWLLALPHLVIVGILAGGGFWWVWDWNGGNAALGGNLIDLLAIIAALVLAFTGTYPQGLFDLLLGLNRWVLRVVAYVGLMTDQYPPFRLDMGGHEPGETSTVPPRPGTNPGVVPPPPVPTASGTSAGWTGGRVVAVVFGALLGLTSLGFLAGGGVLLWAYGTQRDAHGFINTSQQEFKTGAYALTGTADINWLVLDPGTAATVRIDITSAQGPVFVGIARSSDVKPYLRGVAQARVTDLAHPAYETSTGGPPSKPPGTQNFWTQTADGTGPATLTWPVRGGSWSLVIMNADGSKGLHILASAGVKVPVLPWIAAGLLVFGAAVLTGAILLIAVPIRRASRRS